MSAGCEIKCQLSRAMRQHGVRFMDGLIDNDAFISAAADRDIGGDRRWRLPIAMVVVGRVDEAVALVQAEGPNAHDPFYRQFTAAFLERFQPSSSDGLGR
jgi:hypothetical protein